MPIRKPWLEFDQDNVAQVAEVDGVYELGNENSEIILIKGAANLRQDLAQQLNSEEDYLADARYFRYEEAFQYTLRESELLQQYIRQNKRLPPGNEEVI